MNLIVMSMAALFGLYVVAQSYIVRKNRRDAERQIRGLKKLYGRGRYATRLRRFQQRQQNSIRR